MMRYIVAIVSFILFLGEASAGSEWLRPKRWRETDCWRNVQFKLQCGGGGLMMNRRMDISSSDGALNVEISYLKMVDNHLGVRLGSGMYYLGGGLDVGNIQKTMNGRIPIEDEFGVRYVNASMAFNMDFLREKNKLLMVEIPFEVVYVQEHYYFNGGFRLGIPMLMNSNYSYGHGGLSVIAIPEIGTVFEEPLCVDDFEERTGAEPNIDWSNMDIKDKIFCSISLEFGYRWNVGAKSSMMFGVFADYAVKGLTAGCEQMNPLMQLSGNEVAFSTPMESDLISNYNYFIFGIKLGYQWGIGERIYETKNREKKHFLRQWIRDINYRRLVRGMN